MDESTNEKTHRQKKNRCIKYGMGIFSYRVHTYVALFL